MENKRTAMQELMEWMIEESQVIPVDPGDVYQKAKELLLMEKEQMIKFAMHLHDVDISKTGTDILMEEAEQYYNETFKQQDND